MPKRVAFLCLILSLMFFSGLAYCDIFIEEISGTAKLVDGTDVAAGDFMLPGTELKLTAGTSIEFACIPSVNEEIDMEIFESSKYPLKTYDKESGRTLIFDAETINSICTSDEGEKDNVWAIFRPIKHKRTYYERLAAKTGSAGVVPDAPIPITPSDTFLIYPEDRNNAIHFRWTTKNDSTNYKLKFYCGEDPASVTASEPFVLANSQDTRLDNRNGTGTMLSVNLNDIISSPACREYAERIYGEAFPVYWTVEDYSSAPYRQLDPPTCFRILDRERSAPLKGFILMAIDSNEGPKLLKALEYALRARLYTEAVTLVATIWRVPEDDVLRIFKKKVEDKFKEAELEFDPTSPKKMGMYFNIHESVCDTRP